MNRGTPTLVKAMESLRVTNVAVGKTHTLFLTSGGEVWGCGSNKFGELGLGKTSDVEDKPKQITSLSSKVVDVGAGEEFSMVVLDDGSVFSFGHPEMGALGHGTDGKKQYLHRLRACAYIHAYSGRAFRSCVFEIHRVNLFQGGNNSSILMVLLILLLVDIPKTHSLSYRKIYYFDGT